MRKLSVYFLVVSMLLCSAFTFARPNFSQTMTGINEEYTITYSGYYAITAVGCKGGTFNSTAVGGSKVQGKVWLECGDKVRIESEASPSSYSVNNNTLTVPNGKATIIYVNGEVFLTALGGYGTCSSAVTADINSVKLRASTADGYVESTMNVHHHSGGNGSTVYSYGSPGGCYTRGSHSHDKFSRCRRNQVNCTGHYYLMGNNQSEDGFWHAECKCDTCGNQKAGHQWAGSGCDRVLREDIACGNSPTNTWNIGCGYSQHQVIGLATFNAQVQAAYASEVIPSGFSVQRGTTAGPGYVTIEICEVTPQYNGNVVKFPYFKNQQCYLVIYGNTIVYCKHG